MVAKRSKGKATKENRRREPEKKSRGGLLKFFVGLIGVIISPLVVFIKLFNVGEPIPRRWLISLSAVLFLCVGVTWTSSFFVDNLSSESITILAEYDSARLEVRKMPYATDINYIALERGLDPSLVSAIISQQSGFQSELVSFRGNKGLMQISPAVWNIYRPNSSCDGNHTAPACSANCIFDVQSNIEVGSEYLKYMVDLYEGNVIDAVAAYTLGIAPVYIPVPEDGMASIDGSLDDVVPEDDPDSIEEEEETFVEDTEPITYIPPEVVGDVGYTPSILQKWINNRSETLSDRISLVVKARAVRTVMSIVTVVIALIMMCAIVFKYYPQPSYPRARKEEEELDA